MADEPAMTPPAGVVPDFEHPHNQDALGYGVLGAALGISTIALALRIYSRWFVVRQPFIGDCSSALYSSNKYDQLPLLTQESDTLIAAYAC